MATLQDDIIQAIFKTKNSFKGHSAYSEKPGLYAFILAEKSDLKIFGKGGQVIYVGKAEDSLTKRDLKTHFSDRGTGRSTLRRSIGSIFKTDFRSIAFTRNGTLDQTAIDKYKFDSVGENKLTLWMKQNLEIGFWEFDNEKESETLYDLERKVINKLRPTLDLDPRTEKSNIYADRLTALRQFCKNEARQNAKTKRVWF